MKPKILSTLIVAVAGLLSIVIATIGLEFGGMELAALIFVVYPLFVMIGTVLISVLTNLIVKKSQVWLTIVLVSVNILAGILMRLEFYYDFLKF